MANVYVREDGSSDYTTLAAAVTANETDIFIVGRWFDEEDSAITIDDASTTIEAIGDAKHNGYVSAAENNYKLVCNTGASGTNTFNINASSVTINGLCVSNTLLSGDCALFDVNVTGCTIKNCIAYGSNTGYQSGIEWRESGGATETLTVENCIFFDLDSTAIYVNEFITDSFLTLYVNSCTIYNCGLNGYNGISAAQTTATGTIDIYIFNTINVNNTNADFYTSSGTVTWNIDYCIDSDGSINTEDSGAVGCLTNHNITDDNSKSSDGDWIIVENCTSWPYDLRLVKNTYNEAEEMHSSTTGAGLTLPNTDIRGRGRGPSNYDCGAYDRPQIVKSSGGDYTTLGAAITANEENIEIQGTWSSGEDSDYTIDDDYTYIETTGNSKHPGYVGSSPTHFRVIDTGAGAVINITGDFVSLVGLDVKKPSGSSGSAIALTYVDGAHIKDCILWDDTTNSGYLVSVTLNTANTYSVLIENCFLINGYESGIRGNTFTNASANLTINVVNSTIWNCNRSVGGTYAGIEGAESAGTLNINVFSSICMDSGNADFYTSTGTPTWNIDYCIASDTSIATEDSGNVGCLASHNITDDNSKSSDGDWVIVHEITSTPYDLRLLHNTYNEAQDFLSIGDYNDLVVPGSDIAGNIRYQDINNFDCGASEIRGSLVVYVREDGQGDYTTLAAAVTANETDIKITGRWYSAEDSVITISEDNTTIEALDEAKHPGYVGSSPTHYRLRPTAAGDSIKVDTADNFTLDGLDIQSSTDVTGGYNSIYIDDSDTVIIRNCLVWMTGTSNAHNIYIYPVTGSITYDITIENCIIWDAYESGIYGYVNNALIALNINVNSCTLYNNNRSSSAGDAGIYGSFGAGTFNIDVFNSIVMDNGVDDFYGDASVAWNIDYCIESDGTADTEDSGNVGTLNSHNITDDNSKSSDGDWVIVEDITTSPYDLRLQKNTYNEAEEMHSSTTGAGLTLPNTDIRGRGRGPSNYDCGAYDRPQIVKSSGGDYTTLASAITANEENIEIQGTWSSAEDANLTIDDPYTYIEATGDSKHPGYTGSSPTHFILAPTGAGITIDMQYSIGWTWVRGLDIRRTSNSSDYVTVDYSGIGGTIRDCIVRHNDGTSSHSGYGIAADPSVGGCTVDIINCIIHGFYSPGIYAIPVIANTTTVKINSCTLWNNARNSTANIHGSALVGSTVIRVFNTISVEGGAFDFDTLEGSPDWNIHYSIDSDNSIATEDSDGIGNLASHNITDDDTKTSDGDWVIVEDITTSPYDLRLVDQAYNEAQNMHTVYRMPNSDIVMPDLDIVGSVRFSDGIHDVGAYVTGGEGATTSTTSTTTSSTTTSSTTSTTQPPGSVVSGYHTSVDEDYDINFQGNWTGTALITGSGDAEKILFDAGENLQLASWNLGSGTATIELDKYQSGYDGSITVKYRTGATKAACEAAGWTTYSGSFTSLGWVGVRLET